MALEKLERGIMNNAKKEVDQIIQEGKNEAKAILKEAGKRAKEKRRKEEQLLDLQVVQLKNVHQTKARMMKNQSLLGEKKQLIDRVYDRFLQKLQKQRVTVMKNLYQEAKKQLTPGRVYVREEDVKQAKTLFRGVPIEVRPLTGGFIVESKSGDQLVDYSFETIIDLMRLESLPQVSTTLFGK